MDEYQSIEQDITHKICDSLYKNPKSDRNICNGDGICLEQTGLFQETGEEVYSRNMCNFKCFPEKCKGFYYCHNSVPKWVLDINEGFCTNCKISLYNLYKKDFRDSIFKDWRNTENKD